MCIHFRTDIVSFKMVNNTSNMEKLELLVNFQQMILSCPYLNKCLFLILKLQIRIFMFNYWELCKGECPRTKSNISFSWDVKAYWLAPTGYN